MSRGLAQRAGFDCCLFCGTWAAENGRDDLCAVCASPLGLAEHQCDAHSRRRMLPRLQRRLALEIYGHWPLDEPLDAMMCDLSLTGLKFSSETPFDTDRLLKIDCDLFKALARVTHSRPGAPNRYLTDVEFQRLHRRRGPF